MSGLLDLRGATVTSVYVCFRHPVSKDTSAVTPSPATPATSAQPVAIQGQQVRIQGQQVRIQGQPVRLQGHQLQLIKGTAAAENKAKVETSKPQMQIVRILKPVSISTTTYSPACLDKSTASPPACQFSPPLVASLFIHTHLLVHTVLSKMHKNL